METKKKHSKFLPFLLIVLIIMGLFALKIKFDSCVVIGNYILYLNTNHSIPLDNYKDSQKYLSEIGFSNIDEEAIHYQNDVDEGAVSDISIDGKKIGPFTLSESNSKVTISYYSNLVCIPEDSTTCVNKDYSEIQEEFHNAGFENITVVADETLKDAYTYKDQAIKWITIDNEESFCKDDVVRYDVPVNITYQSNENIIQIGRSQEEFCSSTYSEVQSFLTEKGFTNVKEKRNSKYVKSDKENQVVSVTIDSKNDFQASDYFMKDTQIVIEYYSKAQGEGLPVNSSSYYKKMKYTAVQQELENAGFTNVKAIPAEDSLSNYFREDGDVIKVTIKGQENYDDKQLFPADTAITIYYYIDENADENEGKVSPPKSWLGFLNKNSSVVETELSDAGFTNITLKPIADLGKHSLMKENSVKSVSISGDTHFGKGDYYKPDVKVIIEYHTLKN